MPVPPARISAYWTGLACIVFTLLGWSSVPLFVKHFSHAIDAWTSNGWRYGFAALVWAPVVAYHAWRGTLPRGLWKLALIPSAFNILGQVCFTWGFYYVNPGLFTFGLRTQIVFVGVGAMLLFPSERRVMGSPMYLTGILGVVVGALGVVLMGHADVFQGATMVGVLLAVVAGALYAGYMLAVRKLLHAMPSLVAFSVISQYTALAMVGLMLARGDHMGATAADLGAGQMFLLLLSALIGIAIGHVAYYMAIARLGVAVSSGIIQLQPFIVSAFSFLLFDERLSAAQWSAGLVAVGGAGLILWAQARAHPEAARPHHEAPPGAGQLIPVPDTDSDQTEPSASNAQAETQTPLTPAESPA